MTKEADPPAHIGISLGPHRSQALAVRDRTVLESITVAGSDPAELLSLIRPAHRARARGVTVDISRLLLEPVLHRPAGLSPVALIRVLPRPATDPALGRHPADVIERLVTRRFTVPGGHDLFGRELVPLDRRVLRAVCREIERDGIRHIAVVAAGSQAQPRHEREVADSVQSVLPDARISVAYDFGGLGLTPREATVVLNAALSDVADTVLDACAAAVRVWTPGIAPQVGRGDGGWADASRMRTLPVLGLGARDALQLLGAASLAGVDDCRVLLDRPSGPVVGDVRHRLVSVRPHTLRGLGTELVVPTAALTDAREVPYPPDPAERRSGDIPLVRADRDPDDLACVGATVSRPTAWLDEIAFIESTAQLDGIRRDAKARATAIFTANGAIPGTADIVETSTVAVPYSPSGTVRVRVRVAGASDARSRLGP
jgi:hydantoinase/oxoprolinase-like protein